MKTESNGRGEASGSSDPYSDGLEARGSGLQVDSELQLLPDEKFHFYFRQLMFISGDMISFKSLTDPVVLAAANNLRNTATSLYSTYQTWRENFKNGRSCTKEATELEKIFSLLSGHVNGVHRALVTYDRNRKLNEGDSCKGIKSRIKNIETAQPEIAAAIKGLTKSQEAREELNPSILINNEIPNKDLFEVAYQACCIKAGKTELFGEGSSSFVGLDFICLLLGVFLPVEFNPISNAANRIFNRAFLDAIVHPNKARIEKMPEGREFYQKADELREKLKIAIEIELQEREGLLEKIKLAKEFMLEVIGKMGVYPKRSKKYSKMSGSVASLESVTCFFEDLKGNEFSSDGLVGILDDFIETAKIKRKDWTTLWQERDVPSSQKACEEALGLTKYAEIKNMLNGRTNPASFASPSSNN